MTVLDQILDDLRPAAEGVARRGRARRRRIVAAAAAASVASAAGLAVAADHYLGRPAPQPVRDEIAAYELAVAPHLRVNVKLETARVVAISDDAVVYTADARKGGYCSVVVANDATAYASQCHPWHLLNPREVEVEHMLYDPAAPLEQMVVAGRATPPTATSVELRHRDGTRVPVRLGVDRFFVHVGERTHEPFTVVALNAAGKVAARKVVVPPLPLTTEFDDRRVKRIAGRAESPWIDHVELLFNIEPDRLVTLPNGTRISPTGHEIVKLGGDRRFEYRVPEHYRDASGVTVFAATNEGRPVALTVVVDPAYFDDLRRRLARSK